MKKVFLFCLVFLASSSVFAALNLKCTTDKGVVMDKELKFTSEQNIGHCPSHVGIGSIDEKGMAISNLFYVRQDNAALSDDIVYPSGCIYRNHLNVETSCVIVPK